MQMKQLLGALLLGALISAPALAQQAAAKKEVTGKDIAFTQAKGNCLACHAIAGGEQPGQIGPELSNMKVRYPDQAGKDLLRARIWDETQFVPNSIMPPFGKHEVLTKEEFEKLLDYIYGL